MSHPNSIKSLFFGMSRQNTQFIGTSDEEQTFYQKRQFITLVDMLDARIDVSVRRSRNFLDTQCIKYYLLTYKIQSHRN